MKGLHFQDFFFSFFFLLRSSGEISQWQYNNCVETFGTERIASRCIFKIDNRLELILGENKAHTRKIEQCCIFSLLMQLEKKKRYSLWNVQKKSKWERLCNDKWNCMVSMAHKIGFYFIIIGFWFQTPSTNKNLKRSRSLKRTIWVSLLYGVWP